MRRVAALLAFLLAASACGAQAARISPDAGQPRVFVSDGGLMRPVANGERVALADGLAQISLHPYPPEARTDLDVIVLEGTSGRPVRAEVSVTYEMIGMEHGTVFQRATARGEGHHVVPLNLNMPGTWRFRVRIARAGVSSEILLLIPDVDR